MSEPTPFKAGFVAILGRPNVGKSTTLNALLKFKLSIVSPKPQTTRHNILGILNGEGYQICFLDTPGIIERPKDGLQTALAQAARTAAHGDADVLVALVEPELPNEEALQRLAALTRSRSPLILAVNKIDLAAKPESLEATIKAYETALQPAATVRLSALNSAGVDQLLQELINRLPESPAFYDTDQVSDRWERFFVTEIIREKVFELYEDEIPHSSAVVIDSFKEIPRSPDQICATLYVERDSQKGILIGKGGKMIKKLSDKSRQEISEFLRRPVVFDLRISVRKDWRKDPRSLKEFGYTI